MLNENSYLKKLKKITIKTKQAFYVFVITISYFVIKSLLKKTENFVKTKQTFVVFVSNSSNF